MASSVAAATIRLFPNRQLTNDDVHALLTANKINLAVEFPASARGRFTGKTVPATVVSLDNRSTKNSITAVDRLALVWWLSTIYRGSLYFTPENVEKVATVVQQIFDQKESGSAEVHELFSALATGPSFYTALARKAGVESLENVAADTPMPPVVAAAEYFAGTAAASLHNLAFFACAMTVEAAKLDVKGLEHLAAAHCDPSVNRQAKALLWLLDDSKIARKAGVGKEELSDFVAAAVDLEEAASATQKAGWNKLKTFSKCFVERMPSMKDRENRVYVESLISAVRAMISDSQQRCKGVLKPLMDQVHCERPHVPWPADVECPETVRRPVCSVPVAEVFGHESYSSLERSTDSSDTSTVSGGNNALERLEGMIKHLAEQLALEVGMANSLLKDAELEAYNAAAEKAMKKKKNLSSKIHIGRPLDAFLSSLEQDYLSKIIRGSCLGEVTNNPGLFLTALTKSVCTLPLSFEKELTSALTPSNQAGRIPKVPKGTLDTDPRRMVIREHVLELIKSTFARFGAEAISTPVFELRETLMGKYGEDQKLIFDLKDQGGEQLALRYDLTVPFARYCATNNVEKMRRYHIAKVYRRDEPQMNRGRFREFYQCDLDIAGEYDSMVPETEILSAIASVLRALEGAVGPFKIKLNHRMLLDAAMGGCGVPETSFRQICSAIDKLDKSPWEEVKKEMVEVKGLATDVADRVGEFVAMEGKPFALLGRLESIDMLKSDPRGTAALKDLRLLFTYLESTGVLDHVQLCMSLARGLDYYTGVIYEVVLTGQDVVGSVGGGGRYDNLIGMFKGKPVPAVGASVGVERLFRVIEMNLGLLPQVGTNDNDEEKTNGKNKKKKDVDSNAGNGAGGACKLQGCATDVFVASVGDQLMVERLRVAKMLRDAGIAADFSYAGKAKLVKQLTAATDRRVAIVVVIGEEELKRGVVQLRRLCYEDTEGGKDDREVPLTELVSEVKKLLVEVKSAKQVAWDIISSSAKKTCEES